MEIIIIIFLIICLVFIIKLKTPVFDFLKNKTEHMTCDRTDTKACIYDNMIIADKECIYGKKENNIMRVDENIKYNKKQISDLTDFQFKKHLIENVVDNSKGFIQTSSNQYIKKCLKEIDTTSMDLNLKGIKSRYIRLISLGASDWITNAKIQIYSKGIDISALVQDKQNASNSINIDINSEFEINKARISANKTGNDKWLFVLIDINGQIVFSELFTVIPNTPIDIDTQTPKKASVNIPLGCNNSTSNINKYHGDNYNIQSCSNKAKSNNHNYFRLENTNQCYTGSTYNIDNNSCASGSNSRVFQLASDPVYEELGIQDVLIQKGSFRPSKDKLLGYVSLGVNYAVSFNIKLESIKEYETQIFVVTSLSDTEPTSPGVNEPEIQSDKSEFSRIPGVWVCGNSTNLTYAYSIRGNYNNLLLNCAKNLPLNQDVNVIFIKTGTNFKIYMNTELIENVDKPDINNNVKSSGRGAVYSAYNYEAASCIITDFMYISSNKPISIDSLNTIKKNENIEIDKKRTILFRERTLINDNILQKLGTSAKKIKLLYKASLDGFQASTFHSLCNNKGPTITVISANGRISGGYTSESWTSRSNYVHVAIGDAFLFTTEGDNVNKYYNNRNAQHSMFDHQSNGPTFGNHPHDLHISDNANTNTNSYSSIGAYTLPSEKTLFGSQNFTVNDIEVYSTEVLATAESEISKFIVSNNIFTKLGVTANNAKPLYNSKRNGFSPQTFHSFCDNQGPIIMFVRANNRISGGYIPVSLTSKNNWVTMPSTTLFLFTTQGGNINKYYNISRLESSYYDGPGHFPLFGAGHDLYINPSDNSVIARPTSYELPSDKTLFGSTSTTVDEIEVYAASEISKSGDNSVNSFNNEKNEIIDNSKIKQPYYGEPWQQHTTAKFLPDFTMEARAKATTDVVGIYGGHGVTVRKLQLTVNLPLNLGFDNGRWKIHYIFQKKVNGEWTGNGWPHVSGSIIGYNNGTLQWTDAQDIYTEVSKNPQLSIGIIPGDMLRVRASYNYTQSGNYHLNAEHEVKYSKVFTYYDNNDSKKSNVVTVYKQTDYNAAAAAEADNNICNKPLINNGEGKQIYGSWIATARPITHTSVTSTGEKVYIAFDDRYIKMVTQSGEGRYKPTNRQDVAEYNPCNWNSYSIAPRGNYNIR